MKNFPYDSTIFNLLSSSNNHFIFVGDFESGQFQWSKNAVSQLLVPAETTEDPALWNQLIRSDNLPQFNQTLHLLKKGLHQPYRGEYHLNTRDGGSMLGQFRIWPIIAEGSALYYVGVIASLLEQDTVDPITNLRSGYDFRSALSELVQHDEPWGVLIIGIDSFKQINDLHSYTFGDHVLRRFAEELQAHMPEQCLLYRLDGDNFGLLYRNADKITLATCFARLQEISKTPIFVQEIRVPLTFSGGGCVYPDDSTESEDLFRCARIALKMAKTNGNSQFVPYSEEIAARAQRDLLLMERLRESVGYHFDGFSLNYQPLIYADSGKLYGCEVLLRWRHPDFPDGVPPMEFIPFLESSGLILRVGEWVIAQALKQCAEWVKYKPDFQISINVTGSQFEDPEFRFFVMDCLCRERISPNLLTLELTESNKITDTDAISHAFDFFRAQGIKIAFDDFGMGYASLDIFRLLSADELKIDKSFLERLSYDITDQKIIGHLISLCNSMNMNVCVEGVETTEVVNIVQQLGPMLLQGYYYNKPMTADQFETYYFKNSPEHEELPSQDTSTQRVMENTMVYSELRPVQPMTMDDLVNSAYAGIFQVGMDHEFTFLTCNEGYRRMLGYTVKQIEEKFKNQALGFVHPDDMEYVNQEIRRQLGIGDTVTIEFRVVRADGSALWILGTGNVVHGKDGSSSLSVVILNNDIFKRRALEMETACCTYKKILDNMPTGVKCVRYDEAFTLDYISPSFLSLMGYNETEIQTKFQNKYVNLIYKEDIPILYNDIFEQLRESNIVTLRYRTPCKDGRLIWVETVSRLCPPDKDGVQRCYSSVVNVTDTITDEQKNRTRSLANRYQEAASNWGDILFECEPSTGRITFSEQYSVVFGRLPKNTLGEEINRIHPEDRDLLLRALQRVEDGKHAVPIEVRVMTEKGGYLWCSLYFNEPDKLGKTSMTLLGKICNIDAEKRERDQLLVQSQQDPLTGLLNKSTFEERVRLTLSNLQPWEDYALAMIDVDDFKQINDTKGHPFGDWVLQEIARTLKNQMREHDMVGRAGGDEFMAFIKLTDSGDTSKWGESLLRRLVKQYSTDGEQWDVSVSIGISRCPTDGTSFYDLFRRADSALYHAKARGKNHCYLFSGN